MARNWNLALILPVAALIVAVVTPTRPAVTIFAAVMVGLCLAVMAIGRVYRARLAR